LWQRKWVGSWVGPRGKALGTETETGQLQPATV